MPLTGLKGVSAELVECEFFNYPSEIEAIISNGMAATSAGTFGAMNIWKDDHGLLRGEVMEHCVTIESKSFKNMTEAVAFGKKWLPKIKKGKK